MKLKELLRETEVLSCTADPDLEIRGISFNSRTTQPGDLFVAVKGYESDGHRFIPMALEKGAAAVLCEDVPEGEGPYIQTKDSRLALAEISCVWFGHPSRELTMIGVTGTNGKTTVTTLLKHVLEQTIGAKVGLIGTNANLIGDEVLHTERTTPDAYSLQELLRRMADAGCTHVVMEVSSHSLALERVAGITFDVALFTNLSQDHLDLHGTMDEYAAAKKKIFSQCRVGCINLDDERAGFMAEGARCPIFTYSAQSNDADLTAKDVRLTASGVRFAAVSGGALAITKLAIPGLFSVYNALSVLAAAHCLGLPLADCAAALATAQGVKGRMETVPTDGDYSIIIDYSHKPDALEKALKALRPVTKGRLMVLFGCGGDRDRTKRPIMGAIAAENSDLCIVTSDNPRTEEPEEIIREILAGIDRRKSTVKVICDRAEAIRWAIDQARSGDVILLAGKGHEDYQVIGHEKRHMDEREIVADYLAKRKKT